ncbi:RNA polymerase recycling motor HelD [Paenibacillus soyae]|uniref:UvrD-helicase domain-containing protein n=1 Tax=Paenibacillus soyae TaxID=2969249 RepID=A0A9X2MSX8_9BACL|nr:RNA polymerase recycling motor HelD [Paenibacillus soyae]MCR2803157.1 UvrD-helicase domain-containing protein [Paenibacillus soyae]
MSIIDKEREQEQARVDRLTSMIKQRIGYLRERTGGIHGEIVDIRRDFWEDVTVNFEDSAETAETYASMKQQAELLSERERSHRHMKEQLATLERLQASPYFGRIDLVEEGAPAGSEPDQIYLGVGSLLDESGEQYLIYDWRAPVSSLYYDYGPGPVVYKTPEGEVRGEMTLKRQFMIRGGVIKSMFDTGVTIGDELLQEVLGKGSDAAMKSIVATIQQEQNRIIRNDRAKLLIVQGAAGSGKTSAALQRVAYLLYRFRGTLSADQIVLFSPNPMFNSYISTVLPELGEKNMNQTTYLQYLEHRVGRDFEVEDPFVQMEYTLTATGEAGYETRMLGIQAKSSAAYMDLIDAYASRLGHRGLLFKSIMFRGRPLITASAIAEQFYQLDRGVTIPNRLRMLRTWLLKELTRLSKLERKKKWVMDAIELLDNEAYTIAYQELRRKNKFTEQSHDDYESEREFLAAGVVQERFKKLRSRVKRGLFLDMPGIYKALYEPGHVEGNPVGGPAGFTAGEWEAVQADTLGRLEQGLMPYEDATPYCYLKEKLEGFHTHTTVKYVFVDEAQDYSEFQYRYLRRIFPNSRMTLLGDFNQSIFAHSGTGEIFHTLNELFEPEETERITLLRSYRSTKQIVEFAARIIDGGERIEPFNRNGEEPTINRAERPGALPTLIADKLRELSASGFESVAVICKTAEESKILYAKLADQTQGIRLIEKETVTFEKGKVVIPAYLAKGVEFDAVVIADASARVYSRESERKLFYTACTRAMHELHLFHEGELTPFLDTRSGDFS